MANWMFEPPVSTPISRMHGERRIAHDLVLAIGQRLDRRHGDRVAGVHAHRVEVFDRANDHAVVGAVAHDLHFEFLPAEQRFLDEHLADGREIQPAGDDFLELLAVVSDAAALAAEREGGPDDERETCRFSRRLCRASSIVCAVPECGMSRPILSIASLNSWRSSPLSMASAFGADHADAVFFEHAALVQLHRAY